MDLPDIGSHCSLSSCNLLDFLPILCCCNKYFCRHHISPDAHSCTVDPSARNPTEAFEKLQRCATDGCGKPSLESFIMSSNVEGRSPATCPSCHKSFCVTHRHPKSHSCPVQKPQTQEKNAAARALFAKNFLSSPSKPTPIRRIAKPPTDPAKLQQYRKIELMKMRHHAAPGDLKDKTSSVPVDERLHLKVQVEIANNQHSERVFWFRKSTVAGKALDQLALQLGLHSSDSSPLQISNVAVDSADEQSVLRNDQPLGDQVDDGSTLLISSLN